MDISQKKDMCATCVMLYDDPYGKGYCLRWERYCAAVSPSQKEKCHPFG